VASLYLLVGLPAAGRTTVAKRVAEEHAALRLTPDDWMTPLFGEPEAGDKRDVLEGRFITLALQLLRLGTSVVLDFGCWARNERSALCWLVEQQHGCFRLVYVPEDPTTQLARVERRWRQAPQDTFPITVSDLDRWRDRLEVPDATEVAGTGIDHASGASVRASVARLGSRAAAVALAFDRLTAPAPVQPVDRPTTHTMTTIRGRAASLWQGDGAERLTVIEALWEGAVAAAAVAVVGCWAVAVMRPAPAATGDPWVAAELTRLAARRTRRLAVAVIDLDAPAPLRSAFVRAGARTRFEVGSVTKALTGMLLADAIERGELSMDTTVGEVLPAVAGSEVATVSVRELCAHTSGLPRLPRDVRTVARAVEFGLFGLDPYRGASPGGVVALAARQRLRRRGCPVYSNLGAALLGQLLAERAGRGYASLLRDRVLTPLAMSTAAVATPRDKVPHGWSATGLPRQAWVLGGYAPAGGVIATIDDMAKLAIALLDRTAPGASSMDPLDGIDEPSPARRHGIFWIVDPTPDGSAMVWHNGATGGYAAFVALFPGARRAVVALGNTSRPSDLQRIALALVWAERTGEARQIGGTTTER
jgi:CubicO group peptidase (beta-lactamase class C family)/predicted kinase